MVTVQRPLIALVGVLIIVGLFFAFRPHEKKTEATTRTYSLIVKDKQLASGPTQLTAKQGDTVVIKVSSDEDVELHLHGYDKHLDLEQGQTKELSFTADQTGHFPYELEDFKKEIGALDVSPR